MRLVKWISQLARTQMSTNDQTISLLARTHPIAPNKWIIQLALRPNLLHTYTASSIRHIHYMPSWHAEGRLAIESWKAAGVWVPMCAKICRLLADPQGGIHRQENASARVTDNIGSPYFGWRHRPDDTYVCFPHGRFLCWRSFPPQEWARKLETKGGCTDKRFI